MDKKHIGRDGAGTQPICNGGSTRLQRAGLSRDEFKRTPKRDRCARCELIDAKRPREEKTPWNPSRKATARVLDPLPAPTQCPHCASAVELVGNEHIYGIPYGEWPWVYRCAGEECGAYVGLHPYTAIPLGTLADAPTRDARKEAKAHFNPLWQSGRMQRKEAYSWLAGRLGIPVGSCHFGWFDVATCARVVRLIRERQAHRPSIGIR